MSGCVRPKEIEFFRGKDIAQIAAGSTCSFAVTRSGEAYAWGFGENLQLSTGEDVCYIVIVTLISLPSFEPLFFSSGCHGSDANDWKNSGDSN